MLLQSTCPECGKPCAPAVKLCQPCRSAPLYTRFWRCVDLNGPTPSRYPDLGPCWIWTGSTGPNGYGHIWGGPTLPLFVATHVAWTFTYGPIPSGLIICHHCDNPPCVRPEHLFIGSHHDNGLDRVAKGRYRNGKPGRQVIPGVAPIWWRTRAVERAGLDTVLPLQPATGHGFTQRDRQGWLTNSEVQEIRWLHGQGLSNIEIAARFGVARTTISRIVRGKRHAEVPFSCQSPSTDQE
jgi:hypothetical protein